MAFIFAAFLFDELQTDYKNPIDHCNTLSPLVFPEYPIYAFFCVMFLCAAEWLTLGLNMPVLLISQLEQYLGAIKDQGESEYSGAIFMLFFFYFVFQCPKYLNFFPSEFSYSFPVLLLKSVGF
uniref:Uncharacterized protein n=1 Tax=Gopherus agassizii TaxID=38772 RepID=A0A452HXN3_9SAUR